MNLLKLILFFVSIIVVAQNKIEDFPSISKEDYIKAKSSIQEEAVAEVLYRYENYRVSQNLEVEKIVFKRIKIFNKNLSEDYLNVEIPLFKSKSENEKLVFLDAKTYNEENGVLVISKVEDDSKFKLKINENYSSLKFTFPNVKDGSIIEYLYILKSPFIRELSKVYFEEEIPQKYVEYNISFPEKVGYTLNLYGSLKESERLIKSEKRWGAKYSFWKYVYKDVEPYYLEKFVRNVNDSRTSIRPELNSINEIVRLKLATSWDQVRVKLLVDSRFGRELEKENFVKDILPKEIIEEKNKLSKAREILNLVQTNYVWDRSYGIFVDEGLENLVKKKTGNVAEINLLMTLLMRKAGLNANPVILSTIDNGSLNVKSPSVTQQNYVITCVEEEGKIYLYDGTSRLTRENMLSPKVYNDFGVLIGDDEAKIINLPNTNLSQSILKVTASLSENGIIEGDFLDFENKLNAILLKEEYDEDKEKITKIYKEKYPFNNQNFNINFEHDDLEASFHFSSDNMIDKVDQKIIFNPLLFLYSNHHDFNQKEIRKAPIEFTSPFENIKKVTVKIPDNYRIENIPKSKKFKTEDDGIIYSYNIYVEGNNITVESSVKVDSDSFPKEYYPAFKQIFDAITQYEGQLVTVVKK